MSSHLTLKYKSQGVVLSKFHQSRKKCQFLMGPLGSGKTNEVIVKILTLICGQKPDKNKERKSRWVVTRNTYPDLSDTTIRDWLDVVPQALGKFSWGHPPEHKLDFKLEDGTRVLADVIFLALDREDHVKKLRGMQLTGGWMNEGKEQPKSILDMLDLRVGRYPRKADGGASWYGVLVDYNAPDEDEWAYTLEQSWRQGELPDYEFFIQPGAVRKVNGSWVVNEDAENIVNLPDNYYQAALQGKSEDWIKVNLGNEYGFVIDGKPVHPDYVDSAHCSQEILHPVPGIKCGVGLDYGLTPAAMFLQKQPNGRWIAFDELVTEDTDIETFAGLLKAKCANYPNFEFEFIGDPAGDERSSLKQDETCNTVLRSEGINARSTTDKTNDPALRRGALGRPLRRMIQGKPGFMVSPNCTVTRKALAGGFCYRRLKVAGSERYRDQPDKNRFSHVIEAGEYYLLEAGENIKFNQNTPVVSAPVTMPAAPSPFDS